MPRVSQKEQFAEPGFRSSEGFLRPEDWMVPENDKEDRKASRAKDNQPETEGGPLTDEIETEMIDQDIPVETGVRPEPNKAR